jgi:TorA maturation chaperone TorD
MRGKSAISAAAGADVAAGRVAFYELLVTVFRWLPDRDLLRKIGKGDFQSFLVRFRELDNDRLNSGVRLLSSYQSTFQGKIDEDILTELSVDRTRILRGAGHPDLKPPYEGLYNRRKAMGESVLEIIRFYRTAGLLPDMSNQESADYLFVELDFMKQLCLREQEKWLDDGGLKETLKHEEKFLEEHLGSWAGDFCCAVEKHASTDFYRGFSLILDGFLTMDKEWVKRLLREVG